MRCPACKGKKRKHTLKPVSCQKTWCKCSKEGADDPAVKANTAKLLVTRLLNRRRDAEMYHSPEAVKARNAEARKLIEKGCIELDLPSEWKDVIAVDEDATVVPGARLVSEKGCERPKEERSIKGRFIVRGDLEEMGSRRSTLMWLQTRLACHCNMINSGFSWQRACGFAQTLRALRSDKLTRRTGTSIGSSEAGTLTWT